MAKPVEGGQSPFERAAQEGLTGAAQGGQGRTGAHQGRAGADEALAAALAAGQTVRAAALAVGVSEQTVWRRLRRPKFRERVAELRQRMISEAVGKLADNMAMSADVLRELLAKEEKGSVRLGAARANIELGCKLRESTELEARLAALEERLAAAKEPRGGAGNPPPPLPDATEEEDEGEQPAGGDDGGD